MFLCLPLSLLSPLSSSSSSSSSCSLRSAVDAGEIEEVVVVCGSASTGAVVMEEPQRHKETNVKRVSLRLNDFKMPFS